MTDDQTRVLDRLYLLEAEPLREQRFEDVWATPQQLATALDPADPLHNDPAGVRRVLESLWVARKVLQVPDAATEGTLHTVELIDRDEHGPGETRLAVGTDDCRGPAGSGWEEVATFAADVPVRYRSRVAEIARLLSRNYQRFGMSAATGLVRYLRRPQVRPEYDTPIRPLASVLADEFRRGRLNAGDPPGTLDFSLDPAANADRLARATDAVLGALADQFQPTPADPEARLAGFQVRALRATLAGLYCPEYRRHTDAHVVTAGVGSGKTFAFQLGALVHVAEQALAGERGLKVLLLYPRVVLAANQFQDLVGLVERTAVRLGVPIPKPLLDAGGQLADQLGLPELAPGRTFHAIRTAYGGDYPIVITNLDTMANRLSHPEASDGFAALGLVVLDEVHILRGLYGAHARMLLKRLRLVRAVGRVRARTPDAAFERVFAAAATESGPYQVAASATVAEPARHTARVFDLSDPTRVRHVEVGATVPQGWVHHLFLRQRPEVSSMSAVTNATACLVHNRRDGLFREYYQRQTPDADGRLPLAMADLSNPCQPDAAVGPRHPDRIHKTLGFCDSLDGVGRWANLVADNERTKTAEMGSSPNPGRINPAYFLRFQEPLWRVLHQGSYAATVRVWERKVWEHYGGLCRECKRGCRTSVERVPPGLNAAGKREVQKLWDFSPTNEESYLALLGVHADHQGAGWFDPVRQAATADTLTNLDGCGFFRSGLCWWWSMDHLGDNHPAPATAVDPPDGYKQPLAHPQQKYHAVSAIRVRAFTSASEFDATAAGGINDLFRAKANELFRDWHYPKEVEENAALLIASPRIEVGVDLDRVCDGLTYRALRDPASVQQKAGRVGRERGADSVLVHVVTENVRDHFYFRNPHIALDPDYLQPIPLHEDNRIIARQHLFAAILDFLALQGANPDGQRVASAGDRLLLINDHANPPRPHPTGCFYGWDGKVTGVTEYLFGGHPRQAQNLANLRQYLHALGARADELEHPAAATLRPGDAPLSGPAGAVDVFRHDFGPGVFGATVTTQNQRQVTVAQICAFANSEAPPLIPQAGGGRREAFVEALRELGTQKAKRSYLHDLLKLPVFRRGVPAARLPGNQPYLWAPNLFEAVGNETVCVNQDRGSAGQPYLKTGVAFESVSLALALLAPGTHTYRYGTEPYKVPLSRYAGQEVRNISHRLEAVLLRVDDPLWFDPAGCTPLDPADLPPDFPGTGRAVEVYTPRQVTLVRGRDKPRVSAVNGMVADDDPYPFAQGTDDLPQPPRTFPLRWFRVRESADAGLVPCRLTARYCGPSGQQLPRQPWPAAAGLFRAVAFDPRLEVTDFVWGLDQQFATRRVDPARLVYRAGGDPPSNHPVAVGRHFTAPGLRFDLDFAPGSPLDQFVSEATTATDSATHQTLLLQALYAFLGEYARTPVDGGAPWDDPARPSAFTVRNLRTLIVFHLLQSWHPPASGGQTSTAPPRMTLDDLRGCFTPGHQLYIDAVRFDALCRWVADVQNLESPAGRRDTLAACRPNFESACGAVAAFDVGFVTRTARELLLNTLGLTCLAAALRLTGAEDHDLAYFTTLDASGCGRVYLFDTDDQGNGTAEVVRDLFFVSPAERALDARRRALGETTDPPPSTDFLRCLEEQLGECPASQAAHLAYHASPTTHPALADLGPAAGGERQVAGRVFDFLRTRLGCGSFDHTALLQAAPEFLAHLGSFPAHDAHRLVGSPDLPTFQAVESAVGYCLCGCVSCVVSPEQNRRGVLSARETVNKLLLDACFRRLVSEPNPDSYPATGPGRTVDWAALPATVASALGRPAPVPAFTVEVPVTGGHQTLAVSPAAVPAGWERVFRTDWLPAGVPVGLVRPRMVW